LKYPAVVLSLAGLLLICVAHAAPEPDAVAEVVRAEMEKQHIPGLALLVSRKGVPIREQGFGLANVELNVPANLRRSFNQGRSANSSLRRR
jgi:CubicO group peptidase (beta-lactamase class C family)